MHGLHLTADLRGCDRWLAAMCEPESLARLCRDAVARSGLSPVAELFHAFLPAGSGITGVILLAESHLAVHTWPEMGAVTLDVYVCNFAGDNSDKAQQLMNLLQQSFAPQSVQAHRLERGLPPARHDPPSHRS
jgi:S-adenosylmethionine decarboxylase